jgi:soluble lytic murein transglycosylase-like protein
MSGAAIPYLACMIATANFYNLPPRVLPAIQVVEGGEVGATSRNKDGSEDLGVMQINTIWIPTFARVTEMPASTIRARLIDDPCFNIAAAGAILRTYLNEARGDLMLAIGYYHSHTPELRDGYIIRVTKAAASVFGPAR